MALKINHPIVSQLPSPTTHLPSWPTVFLESSLLASGRISISVVTQPIREQSTEMNVILEGKGKKDFWIHLYHRGGKLNLACYCDSQAHLHPSRCNQFPDNQRSDRACVCLCVCVRQQVCNRAQVHPGPWSMWASCDWKYAPLHNPEISKFLVKDVRQKREEEKCLS